MTIFYCLACSSFTPEKLYPFKAFTELATPQQTPVIALTLQAIESFPPERIAATADRLTPLDPAHWKAAEYSTLDPTAAPAAPDADGCSVTSNTPGRSGTGLVWLAAPSLLFEFVDVGNDLGDGARVRSCGFLRSISAVA